MLATRLATGLILVAFIVLLLSGDAWFAPWYPGWFVLAIAVNVMTAIEVVNLLEQTSARPSRQIVIGGVLLLVLANWAPHILEDLNANAWYAIESGDLLNEVHDPERPHHWLSWPLWGFVTVVMFSFIAQSAQFDKPGNTMATIAGTVLAVAYVGLLGSFTLQMRWVGGPSEGLVAVVMLFATAKGADIGAYTLGRIAGRHKLWPRLSPNKTIEGAAGGMILGVVGSVGVSLLAWELFGVVTLTVTEALIYGLIVGATAQLGDLMESMIKRDCAQKDSSDAVPGFGGVLDVVDSVLFAGPVAYGMWIFLRP